VEFSVDGSDITFKVFTTRADTLYGVTYVVLAPESEITDLVTTEEYRQQVEEYKQFAKKQTEIERMSTVKEKTGVFTGGYAINPVNNEKIPIWISDYVLAGYGTGCVMAVPAHDERDFEFAQKFNLPIRRVISGRDGMPDELPFIEDGILVDSMEFSGMTSEQARDEIVKKLEKEGKGEKKVNYRLRDWLVSRQRYWGAPIPIVYCEGCGTVPVPEEQLPVELPYDVEFTPDGESPLAKCESYINTVCPKCGKPAKRDPDTLDTFVCSSWYFLRYPDNRNDNEPFNREWINRLLPVDKYVGGAEHASMHLLYARFFTKALRDMGYLDFDEPFLSLVHQGTILGPDGARMSKSRGNTISPDEYIEEYGSDVFRLYLAFGFAYTEGGPWSDEGIKAISRFVNRVERLVESFLNARDKAGTDRFGADEKELAYVRNTAIKSVTEDADKFQFNTSIARLMELTNALYKYEALDSKNRKYMEKTIRDLLVMLSPFAPHFAEEMWEKMGYEYSIFNQKWPQYDPEALKRDMVELAVQINGQVKYKIEVSASADNKEIEEAALNDEKAAVYLKDREIVRVIVVKGRLVNIVVKK
ncbi:MAG TPA: leucine--tRNA ligase, partial [Ruminiclostridium sp.]|nr:leucine--tRNA ligase [Ruminiclostridium sp.]